MTVKEFIVALGGNTAVAQKCGVKISAVSNWNRADLIPERWYRKLSTVARKKGVKVPEKRFGIRVSENPEARA